MATEKMDRIRFWQILKVDFTEEVKNKFYPKFQDDDSLKIDIEQAYRFVIETLKVSSEMLSIENQQKIRDFIEEITLEEYTNEVYEFICRIAIVEEVDENITSFEQFYEESITMAKSEYLAEAIRRVWVTLNKWIAKKHSLLFKSKGE